jgi:hypothetical protein
MAQRKDPDVPARTPGEAEEAREGAGEMEGASGRQPSAEPSDPREEEGYAQPESSAAKRSPPEPD